MRCTRARGGGGEGGYVRERGRKIRMRIGKGIDGGMDGGDNIGYVAKAKVKWREDLPYVLDLASPCRGC